MQQFDSRDGPEIILTTNPDRLTRRAEEVDELLHTLQARNRRWYSQRAVEAPREWIELTNSNDTEWLRDHLLVGRALPIQRSFYDRVAKFPTRLIMAVERDWTIQAVQAQILCMVEKFGEGPIIILL